MGKGKKLIQQLGQQLQQYAQASSSATKNRAGAVASSVAKMASQTRGNAAVATATQAVAKTKLHSPVVPAVQTDIYGAISAVTEGSQVSGQDRGLLMATCVPLRWRSEGLFLFARSRRGSTRTSTGTASRTAATRREATFQKGGERD